MGIRKILIMAAVHSLYPRHPLNFFAETQETASFGGAGAASTNSGSRRHIKMMQIATLLI
jgi:hypothetical protein